MKLFFRGLLLLLLIIGGVIFYSARIEPNRINVREIKIDSDYKNTLRLLQFSDVHLGPFFGLKQFERLIENINSQEPDVIVFTGDFFDYPRTFEQKEEALEIIKRLDEGAVKLAVYGNHDLGGGREFYKNFMEEAGFQVLLNELAIYKSEEDKYFYFWGMDDGMLGSPDFRFVEENITENVYNILLVHEPDIYIGREALPIDLVLSGHSHGGQIRLPIIGPVVTPPLARSFKDGAYNIKNERGTILYVNTGIGNTKMKFRLGNPPEISLFSIWY